MQSTMSARKQPPPKPARRRRRADPEVVVKVEKLHAVEDRDLLDIDSGFTDMLEQEEKRESTPPPETDRSLEERVAAALAASTRAQSNLRALFRTVKFLGASVGGARETNDHLLTELEALHKILNEANAEAPEQGRAKLLQRALSSATEQAVREREFLIREHDNFIASVVADYENELEGLRARLARAEAQLSAKRAGEKKESAKSGAHRVRRL